MGSEGDVVSVSAGDGDGDWDWDPVAEEELRAIEAAYFAKRRSSGLDADARDHQTKVRRLPDWARSTTAAGGGASSSFPGDGLWSFAPSPCRVNFKMRYPAMTFGGRIVYSRTTSEVEQAAMELLDEIRTMKQNSDQVSLGFDIEWRPMFKRGEAQRKAAVMQICMGTSKCYVMHIIYSGIPPALKSLLEDKSSIKVGICIANDAWKVSNDYDVSVEPLEDLSDLANCKLVGASKRWSLSSLTETVTCKQLEKPSKIRMGNWEAKVLSKEQLHYAATDAFASWYLYQVLKSFPDARAENSNEEKSKDEVL